MNNPNQTATSLNLQAMQIQLARKRLLASPESQADAIASHYVHHAIIAQNILEMLELKWASQPRDTPVTDACIAVQIQIIKDNHLNDLGIALEWKEPQP